MKLVTVHLAQHDTSIEGKFPTKRAPNELILARR